MITGAIGLDDWEWGVTLWGDDLVDMKDLLYEMRFDPSTSRFADFGSFYVGRRFPPEDLPVLLDGGAIPSGEESTPSVLDAGAPGAGQDPSAHSASAGGASDGSHTHEEASGADTADHPGQAESDTQPHDEGPPSDGSAGETSAEEVDAEDIEGRLIQLGLNEGDEYEPDNYGVLLYSNADAKQLATEVDELRGHFEEYDTHVETVVRASGGQSAVASLWETERAADIAEGFLSELPDVTESVRGPLDGEGDTTTEEHTAEESPAIRDELEEEGVYAGQPHGEDIYALVLYSDAERETLQSEVEDLRDGFDRYDTHDGTSLYEDPDSGQFAIVSLWETQDAADTASGYLADLPEVAGWADETEGFGTMGMFYTVKPDHRDDFVEKFEEVGGLLADMDGHRETALMVNIVDDNDMFIASQWDSKDDAMTFFRSEEFSETVDWGRDILADKPRHVFLA
jgi:heme-degrading monooxygenase HmoA